MKRKETTDIQKTCTFKNINRMKLQETHLNSFENLECILYLQFRGLTQRAGALFSPRMPVLE